MGEKQTNGPFKQQNRPGAGFAICSSRIFPSLPSGIRRLEGEATRFGSLNYRCQCVAAILFFQSSERPRPPSPSMTGRPQTRPAPGQPRAQFRELFVIERSMHAGEPLKSTLLYECDMVRYFQYTGSAIAIQYLHLSLYQKVECHLYDPTLERPFETHSGKFCACGISLPVPPSPFYTCSAPPAPPESRLAVLGAMGAPGYCRRTGCAASGLMLFEINV